MCAGNWARKEDTPAVQTRAAGLSHNNCVQTGRTKTGTVRMLVAEPHTVCMPRYRRAKAMKAIHTEAITYRARPVWVLMSPSSCVVQARHKHERWPPPFEPTAGVGRHSALESHPVQHIGWAADLHLRTNTDEVQQRACGVCCWFHANMQAASIRQHVSFEAVLLA